MEGCFHAARGFYDECDRHPECGCITGTQSPLLERTEADTYDTGTGLKDDNKVIDPKSTGRKRAARMFPLNREAPCEWQKKKFPLHKHDGEWFVGCANGLQSNIHHGNNKDTLLNVEGNVHRICSPCHNRWHARVDPVYDWNDPAESYELIFPVDATVEEIAASEIYWMNKKVTAGERSVNPND